MVSKKDGLENIKNLRVRIAPSPTGVLHVGTARTALFNYLIAKKYGGVFVLRIEDTDLERSDVKYEKDILDYLKWLGINYDEGVEIGGPYGPYRQSERIDIYKKYIEKLLEENKAYYCFCTEQELEAQRADMMARGVAPIYLGGCARLSKQEVENNLKNNKPYIIRLRMPNEIISFNDLIRGKLSFDTKLIGDIVIAKNLTAPLYNFAVVIDDELMKISHIIRGEDHISNTPKQIALQKALGFNTPTYAHLPLLLGADRSKLSKRHGATSVEEYKKLGYLPETIINFIALLGWNPGNNEEVISKEEIVKKFSIDKIQKSGAIFDTLKLDWLNSVYIKKLLPEELFLAALPFLESKNLIKKIDEKRYKTSNSQIITKKFLMKVLSLEQTRLKKLSEIGDFAAFFFQFISPQKDLLRWKDMTDEELKYSLNFSLDLISAISKENFDKNNLEKIFKESFQKNFLIKNSNIGHLLWPLRVALSGQKNSPGPFEILEILGKGISQIRISRALAAINQ